MTHRRSSAVAQGIGLIGIAAAMSGVMFTGWGFSLWSCRPSTKLMVQRAVVARDPPQDNQPTAGKSALIGTMALTLLSSAVAAGRGQRRSKAQSIVIARAGAADYHSLVADLEELVRTKNCGPILIRLSWHDAGVFSDGELKGGCPNAAMRFTDGGEGTFGANAGLPDVALGVLAPITAKYVPTLISHADLWALAANVAIRLMGGPDIKTRFGRKDAESSQESVESQEGRLPDADKGIDHLRDIFYPKGFDDAAIVALSGAHTVGRCYLERSGFDGFWTEDPYKFDNSYFKDMLTKQYASETTAKGCPQHRDAATGTIMLISDLALLTDPAFKTHVERYAEDQNAYFQDFVKAWVKLQENGVSDLRDNL